MVCFLWTAQVAYLAGKDSFQFFFLNLLFLNLLDRKLGRVYLCSFFVKGWLGDNH